MNQKGRGMKKIKLFVTGQVLEKETEECIVQLSMNYIQCSFDFRTSDWDGTIKTAVFENKIAKKSNSVVLKDDTCLIPNSVLEEPGFVEIAVHGVKENYRITSSTVSIRNSETIYGGETEIPPELNMWEQILLKINGKADDMKLENDILQLFSEDNPIGRKIRIPPAGVVGREIELRNNGLAIQWRYTDSNHWKDLVLLSDIKGADGETPEFEIRNGHLIVKYEN